MSTGSSLPYRLRPNKAVDRELFLSLLMRLAPKFALERYHYVGLGGPFLEDFRMIHGRLGIAKMTCIETEEQVHKRVVGQEEAIAAISRAIRRRSSATPASRAWAISCSCRLVLSARLSSSQRPMVPSTNAPPDSPWPE